MKAALQAYRRVASREEKELQDVERTMEEELVAEHMQVERVIHLKLEQINSQEQLKYLVKVLCYKTHFLLRVMHMFPYSG